MLVLVTAETSDAQQAAVLKDLNEAAKSDTYKAAMLAVWMVVPRVFLLVDASAAKSAAMTAEH